jgi:hypothetical protein
MVACLGACFTTPQAPAKLLRLLKMKLTHSSIVRPCVVNQQLVANGTPNRGCTRLQCTLASLTHVHLP